MAQEVKGACRTEPKNNLRLVSFDGGGVRSFSQLEIMRVIMHQLKWDKFSGQPNKIMLPCEHIDLIGGSGTGGLIAILLVKLRMSIEEASEEFATIVEEVYKPDDLTPSERTTRLRQHMEDIMKRRELALDTKLIEETRGDQCAGFVITSLRTNAGSKICLRTYPVRREPASTITVIDAVLATCATQPSFSPVSSGTGYRKKEYVGTGHGANNPIREVISEANDLFGGKSSIASLLSLGAGHPGIASFPPAGDDVSLHRVMQDMANDCEQRAQEIEQHIGRAGIYFRFSVEQGMQNDQTDQTDDLSWIVAQADSYLAERGTREKVENFVLHINDPITFITVEELNGGPRLSIPSAAAASAAMMSIHDDAALAKLKPNNLEWGSHVAKCMDGTRQDILSRISDWVTNIEAPNILWLKGHPGVGKSAIASSVVEQLRSSMRLGSCFFFQREKATVMKTNALWRIVAYNLARQYPTARKALVATLNTDESILTTADVENVFRKLIHEPLMASEKISLDTLPVIIIDALDECGGLDGQHSEDRASLMRTLKSWSRLPGSFKLVVTSRGEHDIERLFSATSHRLIEILAGSAVYPESSDDIRRFFEHQFQQIATQYPRSLPSDWPGRQSVEALTERAAGLFIWAKTVVRLVARGEPQQKLRQILEGSGVGGMTALYSWILNASFPSPSEKDIDNFRALVGTVILAKAPLDYSSLMHLLSMESSTVEYICNGLQSVMDSQDILRISHQSFVDFLIDREGCPPRFFIDRERESRNLTLGCLQVMKKELRFNICDLKTSHLRNNEVTNLETQVAEFISPWLSYSSCFWAIHLADTGSNVDVYNCLQYFMHNQFLFWLEVLSLIRRVNQGSGMLRLLIAWIRTSGHDDGMATDMQKFMAAFASVISQSVPHIYLSALPFSPQNSAVSKQFMPNHPKTLTIEAGGLSNWPAVQHVLTGHSLRVTSVAFSPDGKRIVSGSSDATIRVWDAETGDGIARPLSGHTDTVWSVVVSPDGKCIVSGSADKTIRVWDAETGGGISGPFYGHTDIVWSVAVSPDGKRVVSCSEDRTIRVWDLETGEVIAGPLVGHSNSIYSVAFSPDGKYIASGSGDETIRMWNATTGEAVARCFKTHGCQVTSIAFSPDGERVVSSSEDGTVRIWDTRTGEMIVPLEGHSDIAWSSSFSPDGSRIVSGSSDSTIRVWDAETGDVVSGPFNGHTDTILSVAFSPDGERVVSGSSDKTIRVWYPATGEVIARRFKGHGDWVVSVAFSPDGKCIVSGSEDKTIGIWDTATGEAVSEPFRGHSLQITSVAFSPDGKRVVSGSDDMTIRVWDVDAGKEITRPFIGHSESVYSVAFSPDGKSIVSGSGDKTIGIWNSATGEAVAERFKGHSDKVASVAFSPDGERIVSGSDDTTVRIWNSRTGEVIVGPLKGHSSNVLSCSFSPDGSRIVSGSADSTIRVWDAETGDMVSGPFTGHTDAVWSVAFSPDGKHIVSGSSDKTIRMWDAVTCETVAGPFRGHSSRVASVAFSPDGKRIVSGSWDMTIRVWDAEPCDSRVNLSDNPSDTVNLLISTTILKESSQISQSFNGNSTTDGGWILGPKSELLFWVAPALEAGLWWPNNTVVIASFVTTRLDLKSFVHGESWTLCKR